LRCANGRVVQLEHDPRIVGLKLAGMKHGVNLFGWASFFRPVALLPKFSQQGAANQLKMNPTEVQIAGTLPIFCRINFIAKAIFSKGYDQ
jgi:hypothetical protein